MRTKFQCKVARLPGVHCGHTLDLVEGLECTLLELLELLELPELEFHLVGDGESLQVLGGMAT